MSFRDGIVASELFANIPLTLQQTGGCKMQSIGSTRVFIMTVQLKVPSMACSACSDTVTKAVKAIDPTASVQADLQPR